MTDRHTNEQRSRNMAAVKGKDTAPEIVVRRTLHRLGYRFRLHRADLPGKPDIVLPRYRVVVFVHGCFWHGHDCKHGKRPTTRTDFWNRKLDANIARDRRNELRLQELGWSVTTIWECQTRDICGLEESLLSSLTSSETETYLGL